MPVTLFWSRFRDDLDEAGMRAYREDAGRIHALAESTPGFLSIKTYQAEDGERLSQIDTTGIDGSMEVQIPARIKVCLRRVARYCC